MKPAPQAQWMTWAWQLLFWGLLALVLRIALAPTGPDQPDWFENADKLRHAGAFCAFWLVGVRAFGRPGWGLVLGLMLYGVSIECAQSLLTTDRDASLADLLADGAGIVLGRMLHSVSERLERLSWRAT